MPKRARSAEPPNVPLPGRKASKNPLVVPPLLQGCFDPPKYQKLCEGEPNWERNLSEYRTPEIRLVLRDLGKFKAGELTAMAKALHEHIKAIPLQSLQLPTLPPCRTPSDFYSRSDSIDVARKYIKRVIEVTDDGYNAMEIDEGTGKKKAVEKFTLLGPSGVKGIGKTEFLLQVGNHLLPEITSELCKKIVPIYLSFNGFGRSNTTLFGSFRLQHTRAPTTDPSEIRNLCSLAFAHVLLKACNPTADVGNSFPLETVLKHIRHAADMHEDDVLVLLVDEIGDLGDETAIHTMNAVMSEVDAAKGKLVCLFAHISQEVLNSGAKLSGRHVERLALPSLPIDIWKSVPPHKASAAVICKDPGLHQLFLGLSGHPRALFDGICRVMQDTPDLLTSPNPTSLANACEKILEICKFNDNSDDDVRKAISRWLAGDHLDEQQLICNGLLHQAQAHGDVKFLFPLSVMHWARKNELTLSLPII